MEKATGIGDIPPPDRGRSLHAPVLVDWNQKRDTLCSRLSTTTLNSLISALNISSHKAQFYRLRSGQRVNQAQIFEAIKERFNLGVDAIHLITCGGEEFDSLLRPPERPLNSAAKQELIAHDLQRAHQELLANNKFISTVGDIPTIASSSDRAVAWKQAAWSFCRALHRYLNEIIGKRQVIIMIVGPLITGRSTNYSSPVIRAATGYTNEAPDGRDIGELSEYMSEGKFPDPPPAAPLGANGVDVDTGLVLVAWKNSLRDGFPPEKVEALALTGGSGECVVLAAEEIANSSRLFRAYLELSKQTKLVYVFRVDEQRRQHRIVVTMDFIDECQLSDQQRACILENTAQLLSKVDARGSVRQ